MNTTTIEFYKQAIAELRKYMGSEINEENIEQAASKITEYRFRIADAAFDEITHRTARLTTLMFDLKGVMANASKTPTIAGAIEKLGSLVADLQQETGAK